MRPNDLSDLPVPVFFLDFVNLPHTHSFLPRDAYAMRMHSAVYTLAVCLSVQLSVR